MPARCQGGCRVAASVQQSGAAREAHGDQTACWRQAGHVSATCMGPCSPCWQAACCGAEAAASRHCCRRGCSCMVGRWGADRPLRKAHSSGASAAARRPPCLKCAHALPQRRFACWAWWPSPLGGLSCRAGDWRRREGALEEQEGVRPIVQQAPGLRAGQTGLPPWWPRPPDAPCSTAAGQHACLARMHSRA